MCYIHRSFKHTCIDCRRDNDDKPSKIVIIEPDESEENCVQVEDEEKLP